MPPITFADMHHALDAWEASRSDLGVAHRRVLAEIRVRARRLEVEYARLMATNDAIARERKTETLYNDATETLRVKAYGTDFAIPMKRMDPDVPLVVTDKGWVEAYPAERAGLPLTEEAAALRLEMGPTLESYYHGAHRVMKLAQILVGRRVDCEAIAIVRNKLIEHAEAGDTYSFGNGSNGPMVRPLRPSGNPFCDDGLVPNTDAFIGALCTAFTSDAKGGGSAAASHAVPS